jgi:hypothetical protein
LIRRAAIDVAAFAMIVMGPPSPAAPQTSVWSVEVEGTAFRITLSDGHVVGQEELPGIRLTIGDGSGQQRAIRIDAVERDAKDPAGEVVLYSFSDQDPASGEWRNLCEPDPDGRHLGFPLAGAFTGDGRHVEMPGRFLITCTGGAEGKCVRFGYKPWRRGPDGVSLASYYQACVRLVRADYCGDGIGHTRNGTPIDIFDTIGIQSDEIAPGMTFEAAWGPDGAVCVHHTRLKEVLDPAALVQQCPHLAGHVGEICDEATPALLFNRSFAR